MAAAIGAAISSSSAVPAATVPTRSSAAAKFASAETPTRTAPSEPSAPAPSPRPMPSIPAASAPAPAPASAPRTPPRPSPRPKSTPPPLNERAYDLLAPSTARNSRRSHLFSASCTRRPASHAGVSSNATAVLIAIAIVGRARDATRRARGTGASESKVLVELT